MKVGIYLNEKYFSDNKKYIDEISLAFTSDLCTVVKSVTDLDGLNVLFVLGGDGTILTVASECAMRGIKIIGINYGHIGFLAEFEPDKLAEAIHLVRCGNYRIQSRSMLKISASGKEYLALNDLVIQRNTVGANFRNTVSLHAEVDGTTVDNFSSDLETVTSCPSVTSATALPSTISPNGAPALTGLILSVEPSPNTMGRE